MGLGIRARPVGVYVVHNGEVEWQPVVDVTRLAIGAQLVALAGILVLRGALRRRR